MHAIRFGFVPGLLAAQARNQSCRVHRECGIDRLIDAGERLVLGLALLISVVATTGCRSGVQAQVPLETAQESVKLSLEEWKSGGSVDKLKTHSPPIEFYDDDWQKSARLVEYELVKTYCESDGFPRCTVALVIQFNQQEPVRVTVTYQVVMKPNIVIARDPFA